MKALGALALVFYAAHATWHVAHGSPWDLVWVCNVSMPALVLGCFLERARLVAGAVMVLCYGTPMWLLDLATGPDTMVLTSPLVHVGGLVVGGLAVRRLGWPKFTWALTAAATALLLLVSRLATPPRENVNLAFRVHGGWEQVFPSHVLYVALMWLAGAVVFLLVELAARRFFTLSTGEPLGEGGKRDETELVRRDA
jgi:hypothetical protein